jgi:hypothetical protein
MDVNDPFRSAYEDFLGGVDEWIDFYNQKENPNENKYLGRKCFRV